MAIEHNHFIFDGNYKVLIEALKQFEEKIMKELDDLQAKVAANSTVVDSAVELLKGLKEKLDEAGVDSAKLKALSDELGAKTTELAAAVVANTPVVVVPPSV